MSTVSKHIADICIAGNGIYPGDENIPPVVLIIEYDNAHGGKGYGLVYEGQTSVYTPSEYVRNPRVYWRRAAGYIGRSNADL